MPLSLLLRFAASIVVFCTHYGFVCLAAEKEPVEGSPIFFASEILEDIELRTDIYKIAPLVEVGDFIYEFSISSPYGDYRARGVEQLMERINEIKAIDELGRVSQSEAFASSLSKSFSDPVATTLGVARRPVASITGLPGGIVRYFGGKLYQVRRGSGKAMEKVREFREKDNDQVEEKEVKKEKRPLGSSAGKLSRKHLGHDSSKRKWARRLGVDLYSDNEALQTALGRIAWASSLGGFAGDFVVPSSEVFSYAGKAKELVWNRPAHQLEREMVDLLKKCDVSKELIEEFRDSPSYSLTEKLELSLAFEGFRSVGSVTFLIEYGLSVVTDEDAELFLDTVELLVQYRRKAGELVSVGEKRGMIFACSKSGYEIYPLAVDYLHWTPLVYEALLSDELRSSKREVWVSGTLSPIAEMRLRHHGWEVFDEVCE